jgi:hypothetical protein
MIFKFAEEKTMRDKLFTVSLGQGQGEHAKKTIARGRDDGNWVLL